MVLTVMQPTTLPLLAQNIINGGIETIVIAKENKGTHTVNLNIKDGSIIGAANNNKQFMPLLRHKAQVQQRKI